MAAPKKPAAKAAAPKAEPAAAVTPPADPTAVTTAPTASAADTAAPIVDPTVAPVTPTTPPTAGTTTLDSDVTKPSVTAPGDGPADTTDPTQIAVSVPAQPGAEAVAVGTVNAVKEVIPAAPERDGSKDRIEVYEATKPDGTKVEVTHNLDTGETSVK